MRLYDDHARRLYLNSAELDAFIASAGEAEREAQRLALLLAYTGMRLSEACTLTFDALQPSARTISVRTLKQRGRCRIREIPVPSSLVDVLTSSATNPDHFITTGHRRPMPRITGYRHIKRIMGSTGLTGTKACPKGLRHAFGVRAVLAQVPLNVLQHWMGHASMTTTAIYTSVIGKEQLEFADRMWVD